MVKFNVKYLIPTKPEARSAIRLGCALIRLGRDFLYWRNHDIDLSTVRIEFEPAGSGARTIRVSGFLRD